MSHASKSLFFFFLGGAAEGVSIIQHCLGCHFVDAT